MPRQASGGQKTGSLLLLCGSWGLNSDLKAWQQVPLPAEHLTSPLRSSKLACAKYILVQNCGPRHVLRFRCSQRLTNIRRTVGNLGRYCILIILASNSLEYIQTSKWKIKEVRHSALDGLLLGLLELVSAGEGSKAWCVCIQLFSSPKEVEAIQKMELAG